VTPTAAERHDRQRLMPEWDQDRIARATAVIAGVGALGNEVAKNLGLLGFGHLLLCDRDTVELTNLNRSALFTDDDIGRPKAEAAAASLRRLAPSTSVTARVDELTRGVGLGELADASVVLGCLDSRHARLRLLHRCALVDAPLVDGGTHPWGGEVRVRVSPDESCYGCSLTAAQRGESDDPLSCGLGARGPEPASIMSTALVASWMTMAAVRLVLGQPFSWRFLELSGAAASTTPVTVARDPDCPYHEPVGIVEPAALGRRATLADLLAVLPVGAEPLAWAPFPTEGTCDHCHRSYDPGYSSEQAIDCPHCGGHVRLDRTQRLRAAKPDTPLALLGVAAEEIIAVRIPEGGYRWLRMAS
jgi:molybdopterin/thiamine biosynthesis adenylyltransferase